MGSFKDFYKLQGSRVTFLKEDLKGSIWIGTLNEGVYSYDQRGRYFFDPLINNNIKNLDVTGMEIDDHNNLWVGSMDGLIYFEIENRQVARLTQVNGLRGNDISSIFADSRSRIFACLLVRREETNVQFA